MSAKHGDPLRGLMSTARSPLFDGKFGRLFRSLPPATFGASEADNIANLTKLGAAMSSEADPADPKVGKDDEESGIPALYTYGGFLRSLNPPFTCDYWASKRPTSFGSFLCAQSGRSRGLKPERSGESLPF